jgi:hypothetical protein
MAVAKWVLKDSPASVYTKGEGGKEKRKERQYRRGRKGKKEYGGRTARQPLTTTDELVRLSGTVNFDLHRVGEGRRVAVGRNEVDPDELLRADTDLLLAVVDGGVDLGATGDAGDGRSETESFFDVGLLWRREVSDADREREEEDKRRTMINDSLAAPTFCLVSLQISSREDLFFSSRRKSTTATVAAKGEASQFEKEEKRKEEGNAQETQVT